MRVSRVCAPSCELGRCASGADHWGGVGGTKTGRLCAVCHKAVKYQHMWYDYQSRICGYMSYDSTINAQRNGPVTARTALSARERRDAPDQASAYRSLSVCSLISATGGADARLGSRSGHAHGGAGGPVSLQGCMSHMYIYMNICAQSSRHALHATRKRKTHYRK